MDDNGDITRSSTLFPSNTSEKTQKAIQAKVTEIVIMVPSLANGNNVDHESTPQVVEEWFHEHIEYPAKPKITKLHFFVHDNVTADHPTSLLIAPANTNNIASISFGSTYAMDAPITTDSDPNSKFIGRAQGDYKGISLCVLGNNPISHEYREMPILGGTGVFRLASGIATVNTVIVDIAKLNDILECHVVIQHY
ncbi:OLC1v1007893C1 [Oldenlandia corymbosa var. corymbosa]|uniref:Dirigent protein n=1 Tax=Oldenlandia corymbosa var. corymbosa TaxID=529605 RepID=A0AAV1DKQ8_OLDCO|nr:OLC1v1007893C1 [Oldenlandia corymbosa var. corymbosa]